MFTLATTTIGWKDLVPSLLDSLPTMDSKLKHVLKDDLKNSPFSSNLVFMERSHSKLGEMAL